MIALANADPRPDKIDVGVGVYRDGIGRTPILRAVKAAEKRLWETQDSKGYLGGAGDKRFAELLRPIVLGEHAGDDRIAGLQTPGGCGALRLGFQLIAAANPQARVLVGTPTWPNHHADRRTASGSSSVEYPYYDRDEPQHPLRRDDGGDRERRAPATSCCSTAAATIRPGPTSTRANGPRSRGSSPSAGCCRSSTSPTRGWAAGSTRMRRAFAASSPRATKC